MMNTMESQNYLNSNNFGPVQQPVTVNHGIMSMTAVHQPLQQPPMWQVNQNMAPVVPAVLPMPTLINVFENVPANADFWVVTPTGVESALPSQCCISQNGNFVAPQGWTLMPRDEFFKYQLNLVPFPTNVTPITPSPSPSPYTSVSRSPSVEPVITTEQTETPKKTNVKRPHRAKQIKIADIHAIVKEYCVNQGIFADEKEVLRGEDVLRIHVKTWEGLDLIEAVIEEVQASLPIARIALPFSMKNKFQKKGFICYMKVQNVNDVPLVQNIFSKYSEAFKKCDVALPTMKDPTPGKVDQVAKPVFIHPFSMSPPTMAKRSSAA